VIPTDYCNFYAATLAGFDAQTLRPLREQFLHEWVEPRIANDARVLLSNCRAAGDTLVLTTATNRAISELTATSLGVDHFICTELEMSNGRYTGRDRHLNMRSEGHRIRACRRLSHPVQLLQTASTPIRSTTCVLSAVRRPLSWSDHASATARRNAGMFFG
jgi:phosphoserine phosphatase